MDKFSVLMSVYKKENPDYMTESLISIFNQSIPPTEVILVEDGPLTRELYAVVDKFKKEHAELKVVSLEKNGGLGHALNIGLKYCSNNLVARMDTDDICKPYRFKRQLKVFAEHLDIDVCSSWIDEFADNVSNVIAVRAIPEKHVDIVKYAKERCPINHPAVMYKKEAVLKVGGYQCFPEDYYLWTKMIMNGYHFYNIQESLLWFRFSPEVVKRRGGWSYAKDDFRAQWNFYKIGFLKKRELAKNIVIRSVVRLMPNGFRVLIYKKFLRH